jgi:hypothetical protein
VLQVVDVVVFNQRVELTERFRSADPNSGEDAYVGFRSRARSGVGV